MDIAQARERLRIPKLWQHSLRIVRLLAVYHLHAAGAKLFERPFWFFEQRRSSLRDRIDNERSAR